MISLIAAIGKNNELGKKNALLWNLPTDMKHFRDTTRDHTVIMGQKTFESMGKPLPNRRNIVVTRNKEFNAEGIEISYSLEDTMRSFKNSRASTDTARHDSAESEVFVIGGGEIYKQTIQSADRLYITHVDQAFPEADAFFPEIDLSHWKITSEKFHPKDDKHPYDFTFKTYEKLN